MVRPRILFFNVIALFPNASVWRPTTFLTPSEYNVFHGDYWNEALAGDKRLEVLPPVVMKSSTFWDAMPYSPWKVNRRFSGTGHLHFQGRILSGDQGDIFLRNVDWFSTDYKSLYPRRWNSSKGGYTLILFWRYVLWGSELNMSDWKQEPVVDCCEYSNENKSFLKWGTFLGQMIDKQLPKDGFPRS
jgi:hypothetical protein